jgi:hypothetical protein
MVLVVRFVHYLFVILPPLLWEECFQFDPVRTTRVFYGTSVFSCSNTGSARDYSYWTPREYSVELMELSSVSLRVKESEIQEIFTLWNPQSRAWNPESSLLMES